MTDAAGREGGVPPSPVLQGWQRIEPLPLSGSERRLFRLHGKRTDGCLKNAILVDAREDAEDANIAAPYLQRLQELTFFLTKTGLRVPRIEAVDRAHGVVVVEDLGANSYARCLGSRGIEACRPLFRRALDDLTSLSQIDATLAPEILPAFTEERFVEQTMPFADAFLTKERKPIWQELWRDLYHDAAFSEHELAPVLGDVHIENMFVLPEDNDVSSGEGQGEGRGRGERERCSECCVFIDFQDAHIAPRCYDVVSLLEDGLWSMPKAQREEMWDCYKQAYAERSATSAVRHYALCALHREVRMTGILHRLLRVRGEARYGAWLETTERRCRRRLAEETRFANLKEFLERNTTPSYFRAYK